MRRRRLPLALSLLVVALSGARASACTCAGAGSPCEALGGATVSAEGAGGTREARVDSLGRYRLTGVAPGALKLRLHLPDELTASRKERTLTVADRGCASEDFYVMDNGRMSGRVFDAEGQPLAGVGVVILSAGVYDIDMHSGRYGKTDAEGRWAVSALPAGRFAVGVNVRGTMRSIEPAELPKDYVCPNCYLIGDTIEADEQAGAYPRLFYPGVFRLPKAEVFLLGPGHELRDMELRLPPRPPAAVVRGAWSGPTAARRPARR